MDVEGLINIQHVVQGFPNWWARPHLRARGFSMWARDFEKCSIHKRQLVKNQHDIKQFDETFNCYYLTNVFQKCIAAICKASNYSTIIGITEIKIITTKLLL